MTQSSLCPTVPMRVLMICRSFPPVQHSGTLRNEAFCRYLPEFGVAPVVLSGRSSTTRDVKTVSSMTELNGWVDDDRWIEVRRVEWNSGRRRGLLKWLQRLPLGSSIVRAAGRRRVTRSLLSDARELVGSHRPDVVLASVAPPETLDVAVTLGREYGLPVVADVRDPWSYAASAPYRHYVDFLVERSTERRLLAKCAHVVVTCAASRDLLIRELGVAAHGVSVIPNGFEDLGGRDHGIGPLEPGRFVIAHIGEMSSVEERREDLKRRMKRVFGFDYDPLATDSTARSPKWLLAAAERIIDQRPELRSKLLFLFVGVDDPASYRSLATFKYPNCLQVMPRVSADEANRIARQSDLLVLMQNRYSLHGNDFCVAVAAKTYAYLASGRPILACVQPSEMAELVRRYSDGEVVDPCDVDGIEEALMRAIDRRNTAENAVSEGGKPSVAQFHRRDCTYQLAQLLRNIANNAVCDGSPLEDGRRGPLAPGDAVTSEVEAIAGGPSLMTTGSAKPYST